MKRIFLIAIISAFTILQACSPKYLAKGVITSSYQNKTYKTIILPPVTIALNADGNNSISELAYKDITNELAGISSFVVIGDYRSLRKSANTYKYGALENTDINAANKVAKSMGADAFVVSKISREKENLPIRINIEIYNINGSLLYSGQGRAANPISVEAETEAAVEFAFRELKKK